VDNEILTIQQAAEFLQICDKTVRRLISKKELPASKIGGSWRVKRSDIEEYLLQTRNK
jgi:excisionase family DNA binding protein